MTDVAELVAELHAAQTAYERATDQWIVAGELADRANDRRLEALARRDAATDAYNAYAQARQPEGNYR